MKITPRKLAAVFAVVAGIVGYNVLENINDSNIKSAQGRCSSLDECKESVEQAGNRARDIFVLGFVGLAALGLGADRLARRYDAGEPKGPG